TNIQCAWSHEKLRGPRFPLPEAILHTEPKISFGVFIHAGDSEPEIVNLALQFFAPRKAEFSTRRKLQAAGPNRAIVVLKQAQNQLVKFGVGCQLLILPTRQSLVSSNPQSSIACGEQAEYCTSGELLSRRRLPRHRPHTIKANQAEIRSEPEISVG